MTDSIAVTHDSIWPPRDGLNLDLDLPRVTGLVTDICVVIRQKDSDKLVGRKVGRRQEALWTSSE